MHDELLSQQFCTFFFTLQALSGVGTRYFIQIAIFCTLEKCGLRNKESVKADLFFFWLYVMCILMMDQITDKDFSDDWEPQIEIH